jgi:spore coat polysaccharide biosynthesis protein SpsF (cytidylyltransferase family)
MTEGGGVVAVIQARMSSVRLPGKVLLDIEGQSMLERVVRRMQRAQSIDKIIVATTTESADDAVADVARNLGVHVTRGSEEDVLDRFRQAANETEAETIMRVCADSPFVDPLVCDMVVDAYRSSDADYASNKLEPSFPLGLDVEVFSRAALEQTWLDAKEPYERAHVTVHMYAPTRGKSSLLLQAVTTAPDRHDWRWTVDTQEDLDFAREAYRRLGGREDFSWLDVVLLIDNDPSLAEINGHLKPKHVTEG